MEFMKPVESTKEHKVNDTDLNKIYAFDKIAKLLSDNKFEAVTDKEEVRGLHRDSETGKVSECVYATFLGETKYKLNLTSDEVWELLCYVLEGMDKIFNENGRQISINELKFKHDSNRKNEYNSEKNKDSEKDKDKETPREEVKEDGSGSCDDCDVHNVDNPSCNLGDIPISLIVRCLLGMK